MPRTDAKKSGAPPKDKAKDHKPDLAELKPCPFLRPGASSSAQTRNEGVRKWLQENIERRVNSVALCFDEDMLLHAGPPSHPEAPARLQEILGQLWDSGLMEVCKVLPSREATREEILRVHTEKHLKTLAAETEVKKKGPGWVIAKGTDTYVCEGTLRAAHLAVGCLLNMVDACFETHAQVRCGMAVVRPPGHHATADVFSGFCIFNNVAVAARHAQEVYGLQRIAIVDWDVHHGNGTSDIFAEDPNVLFFSMHRFGNFFPLTGAHDETGKKTASGFTVNVPLDKGYSDADVCYVMRYVICPMLESFHPEAIFISAGFDAVRGDPLGECKVSPEGFGWMTRCLYRLATHYCESRLFLVLEGGYDPDLIAQCSVECVRSLVAEATGVPGPWADLKPLAHSPVASATPTPAASPAPSPFFSSSVAPKVAAATIVASPEASMSAPASPTAKPSPDRKKVRGPLKATMKIVRKLTELHHILGLELPVAPLDPSGSKNAKRSERRRHKKGDGADTDGEDAWSIASGEEPEVPFSPATGPENLHHLPDDFELPPQMPESSEDEKAAQENWPAPGSGSTSGGGRSGRKGKKR